jgi:hypothetical protein
LSYGGTTGPLLLTATVAPPLSAAMRMSSQPWLYPAVRASRLSPTEALATP